MVQGPEHDEWGGGLGGGMSGTGNSRQLHSLGQKWVKTHFSENDPEPFGMLGQVFLASDIHGLRLSRHGAAGVPPVDPRGILYVGMYTYHEAARVMISDMGYRHCIYLWCVGATISYGGPRVTTVCFCTVLEGAYAGFATYTVRTRGRRRLRARLGRSPPETLAMYQQAFACAQQAVDYMGSGMVDVSTVADVGIQQRAHSCFAACVLLCNLVAALHP